MLKRVPTARAKAETNMQVIAPASRRTIGNTLDVRSLFLHDCLINCLFNSICKTFVVFKMVFQKTNGQF